MAPKTTSPANSSLAIPRPRAGRSLLIPLVAAFAIAAGACGGAPTADDVERSMREFQLAASLREEGNTAGAVERLRKSLELDPDNARAHLLMGYIFMERRDFITAEPHLRKGLALMEKEGAQGGSLPEARNVFGVVLIELGKFDEAVEVLRQAASDVLNTAPHLAWGNLGLAQLEKKDYDAALEALSQAVRIQPRFCVGYHRMSLVFFARKDFERAEEASSRAIEADDLCTQTFQDAYRLRGEARAHLSMRDGAIADFERCVEIAPKTDAGKACRRFLEAAH